jgi:hypothetical protein
MQCAVECKPLHFILELRIIRNIDFNDALIVWSTIVGGRTKIQLEAQKRGLVLLQLEEVQ